MFVEAFGEFGKTLRISPLKGEDVSSMVRNSPCGVGSLVDGEIIAAYCIEGRIFFCIGMQEFGFPDSFDTVQYFVEEKGICTLLLKKGRDEVARHTYRAWWRRDSVDSPAGFGDVDDQEHDIGAYLTFMFGDSRRREFLLSKWCM